MTREFDCIECGRHIISFGFQPWDEKLCAMCVHIPGWFRIPGLCELLDNDVVPPEHEREVHKQ